MKNNPKKILILLSLLLSFGCSNKSSMPSDHNDQAFEESNELFDNPDEIILYNPNYANAANLKRCAFLYKGESSCEISESPLIGIGKTEITINDILDRTMATKRSYMDSFKIVLEKMPKETLAMFGSINSVVISERINPSFYTIQNGGIYLSALYFWKTPQEKEQANSKKDYRAEYGTELKFDYYTSYYNSLDGSPFPRVNSNTRVDDELVIPLARLLFHELAHANDYFPKSFYNSEEISLSKTYYKTVVDRWDENSIVSQKLTLTSSILHKLGQILFQGEKADSEALNTNAITVFNEYVKDGAADMYGYSTYREDLAMLVERNLMLYYYQQAVCFLALEPAKDNNYRIVGGVKNKIANENVKSRAKYAMESIFNNDYTQQILGKLDGVQAITIPENATSCNI